MRRLLIRPGAIGDFVLGLPEMEELRSEYTEVWCATANVPLVRFAERAVSIAESGVDRLGVLEAGDVVARLRQFDQVVSWYGSNRPEFRQLVAELGLPFEFRPALQTVGRRAKGIPRISVPAVNRSFGVVHPFASSGKKRAPMEWFRNTAVKLQDHMPVYWLAGPEEELEGAVRLSNLYDLACWLAGARVYVGNDSGISHLAAAVGAPVLAAFVSTDSRLWAPRGLTWVWNSACAK